MSKSCTTLILAIGLVGCNAEKPGETAAAPASPAPAASSIDLSREQLLAEAPEGWVQSSHTEGTGIRMVSYVPPSTDPNDWTDKVSFESFSDPPLPDPIDLLKSIADDQRRTCEQFSDHETFSGMENEYPTSVRLFVCYVNSLTKKGQLTLVKTIRGDASFYVITRAQRTAPIESDGEMPMPPETMAEWSLYLRAIQVCNDSDPNHPCPAADEDPVDAA